MPDQRPLDLPGLSGRRRHRRQLGQQQFQLDAFGEVAAAVRRRRRPRPPRRRRTGGPSRSRSQAIEQRWHEPDAGIWELDPDAWTHSRLICAAGLRRSPRRQPPRPGGAVAGSRRRDRRRHRRARAAPRRATGSARRPMPRIDAALLLPGLRGARARRRPAHDRDAARRSSATLPGRVSATGSGPTTGRSAIPKARFCMCGFIDVARPYAQQGDAVGRRAGSSATGRPAGRPACSPRSTTSTSASCGEICRRRSSTPCCWSAPSRNRRHEGPFPLPHRSGLRPFPGGSVASAGVFPLRLIGVIVALVGSPEPLANLVTHCHLILLALTHALTAST